MIDALKKIDDPYPYFRGLISEIGFDAAIVEYIQPTRKRGMTSNHFYTLYDIALLCISNHSKIPLGLPTMLGFLMGGISLFLAIAYLFLKLFFLGRIYAGG